MYFIKSDHYATHHHFVFGNCQTLSTSRAAPRTTATAFKSGQYLTPDVTVYGYHPYWGGDPLDVDLTPLTHIAIFDVGMNTNGQITDTAYWHLVAEDLVTKAHGMGVKVHLCLTSFSDSVNNVVLPSASKRAVAAEQLATH